MSTQRIEAFSDAVFAIAITLLVLENIFPDRAERELFAVPGKEGGPPMAGLRNQSEKYRRSD